MSSTIPVYRGFIDSIQRKTQLYEQATIFLIWGLFFLLFVQYSRRYRRRRRHHRFLMWSGIMALILLGYTFYLFFPTSCTKLSLFHGPAHIVYLVLVIGLILELDRYIQRDIKDV